MPVAEGLGLGWQSKAAASQAEEWFLGRIFGIVPLVVLC